MKRSVRTVSAVVGVVALAGAVLAPANAATKKITKKTTATKVSPTTKAPTITVAPVTTATPTTAATAAALPPLTKPIRILVVSGEGTASTNLPELRAGAQAAAKRINAAGGVRGAKMEIVWCNDQVDATAALACARQAGDNIDAVIVAGRFTGTYPSIFAPIGLPVFDANATDEARLNSDQYMNIGSGSFAYGGLGIAGVKAGGKKIAIYAVDSSAAAALAQFIRQGVLASGGTIPVAVTLPVVASDLSPQAQQIKASGADMVCGLAGEQITMLLFQALDQIGANVRYCTPDSALSLGTIAKNPGLLEGTVIANQQPQVGQLKDNPDIAAFLVDLRAAGEDYRDTGKAIGVFSWASVGVIADVAKTMPTVDAKSLTAALNKSSNLKVPGFGTWTPGAVGPVKGAKRVSNLSYFASIIKNGRPVEFINNGDVSPAFK